VSLNFFFLRINPHVALSASILVVNAEMTDAQQARMNCGSFNTAKGSSLSNHTCFVDFDVFFRPILVISGDCAQTL